MFIHEAVIIEFSVIAFSKGNGMRFQDIFMVTHIKCIWEE